MMCHNVTRGKEPPEIKERVIHTRVPESLEAELRRRAENLGMSVSNLVRNVLGHAFGLVGDVVADSHAIARAASGARDGAIASAGGAGARAASGARDGSIASAGGAGARAATGIVAPAGETIAPIDDVLAWQVMVLGKNALCARCNDLLPRGHDAAIGVAEHGGARVVVCTRCFEEVRR
jgi:hypothetical protein